MLINGYTPEEARQIADAARPWPEVEAEAATVQTFEDTNRFVARLLEERPYLTDEDARLTLLLVQGIPDGICVSA